MKNWVVFKEADYAPDTDTLVYTVPTGQTASIDKCTAFSAAGGTITFYIVGPSDSVGAANVIFTKTLAANEEYTFPEMVGQCMVAGDRIYEKAATASTVSTRLSGRAGT